MSTEMKKEVKCPGCGAMSQARMWSGINAEVNPNLRLSVLEESLFDWTCPHCGYQAMLAYPCLYHDKGRRFMVYVLPGEPDPNKAAGIAAQFPQLRGVRKRVTGSLATLKEKILLFEDGLDDRAAELVKLLLSMVLAQGTGKRVEQGFYCSCDEEKDRIGFSFFIEGEEEPVRRMTSFAAYRQALSIAESLLPPDGEDFLLVNEAFARALLYRYRHGGEMPEAPQETAAEGAADETAPAEQPVPREAITQDEPRPEPAKEAAPEFSTQAEPEQEPQQPKQTEQPEQTAPASSAAQDGESPADEANELQEHSAEPDQNGTPDEDAEGTEAETTTGGEAPESEEPSENKMGE